MKNAILAVMLSLGMVGSANALEPLSSVFLFTAFGGTMWLGGAESDQKSDPRLFKSVTAQRVGEPGYSFDLTQYEYDQNPGKYVIVK